MIETVAGMRDAVLRARASTGGQVALVPTMGALHKGHLSLVRRARELGQTVVVSIFVNPLQFGPGEDLERYPRTLEADLKALASEGVELVFAPTAQEMYPDGPTATRVTAGEIGSRYEGGSRPGHFDGMLTVVAKLLNIVKPDFAVFGQKDAQQVFLVQQMVRELNVPVAIEVVPTEREADGLAISSRNRYLDDEQHAAALALSQALAAARQASGAGLEAAVSAASGIIAAEPAVKLDYLVAVDPESFLPVEDTFHGRARMLLAARVGSTRLIDNDTITVP